MLEHLLTNILQSSGLEETIMLISQAIFPLLNLLLSYKTIRLKKKKTHLQYLLCQSLRSQDWGRGQKAAANSHYFPSTTMRTTSWFFNSHFSSTECKRLTSIKLQQCIVHELQALLLFKSLPFTRKQGQGGERTVEHTTNWFNDSI